MGTLKRIKKYIDYKGITLKALEQSIGMSNGAFGSQLKNNRTIGVDKIENFLLVYNDVNPEWLLTGKGPMLKEGQEDQEPVQKEEKPESVDSKCIEYKLKCELLSNQLEKKEKELAKAHEKIGKYKYVLNQLKLREPGISAIITKYEIDLDR